MILINSGSALELKPEEFRILDSIVSDYSGPEPLAVITGNNPGRILVDDGKNPGTAIVQAFTLIDRKRKLELVWPLILYMVTEMISF